MNIQPMLPFLIPLIVGQFILLGVTLHHILTHERFKRGTRTLWLVISLVGMGYIGPILYWIFGKENRAI